MLAKPGATHLTIEELENGWDTNPDGGGIAWIADGKIETFHTMDRDTWILRCVDIQEEHGAGSPIIMHARIATHGAVKLETTHPFMVNEHQVMAHNGVISNMSTHTNTDVSDTMAFAVRVLAELPDTWMDIEVMVELVGEYIGYSKLTVLTTHPDAVKQWYVVNEDMGEWVNDVWHSNKSCLRAAFDYSSYKPNPAATYKYKAKDYTPFASYDWKPDVDEPDVMYTAAQMVSATIDEFTDMCDAAAAADVKCLDCMGVDECYCADKCSECYEMYWECECSGDFVSLWDYMTRHVSGTHTNDAWCECLQCENEGLVAYGS